MKYVSVKQAFVRTVSINEIWIMYSEVRKYYIRVSLMKNKI